MIENPIHGGTYAYGKTAVVAGYDGAGCQVKIRRKARSDWLALMPNAHEGYVSWEKAEAIRKMVSSNVPTSRHHAATMVRPSTARLCWRACSAVADAGVN